MADQIDIDIIVNMNNVNEVDELTSKLQEATGNVESLQQELANIELGDSSADFDTVSNALSEAETEAETLKNKLNEVEEPHNVNISDEDVTKANDDVDTLTSNLDGLSALAVGQTLQQYGANAENLAQQMNTASISVGQLATQTSIAEPEMVSLINNISNATFPNNEAMMYVKSLDQMGVSSENLGKSATDLDKINDAFGLGANTVNSLGQELGVLGVDMNNVSSSFNSLAYANSNTVGGMQNYFSFLRRFDADLSELGYDADQTALIISAATQKYGGGRAALSGLSGALKDAGNDTKALEEALGMEAGSLDKASQITGEYEGQLQTLADEEAEHKTILDQVGAAWEDISLSISGVAQPIMSVVGLSGQVAGFGMQLNGTWELLSKFRNIDVSGGIGKVSSAMGTAKSMMDALRNSESITEGVRAALAIATGAEATAEGGAAAAKGAAIAPTTGLAIAENSLLLPLLLIVGAVVAVIAVMWYLYNTNETVRNGINWLVAQIQNFINALMPIVNAIVSFVTQGLNYLNNFPGGVWGILLKVISFVFTWQIQLVQAGIKAAQQFISQVGNALRGIGGVIQSALSNVYNFITAPFKRAYDFINNTVIKPLQDAWNWLSGGFSGFGDYESFEGYSGVSDTLNNTVSTIAGNSSNSNLTVNNNFNGLVEESAADYIVSAVNDRLRREKLLKGV